jgi:hypothetical protein
LPPTLSNINTRTDDYRIIDTTYISTMGIDIIKPTNASFVNITNMGGGGAGSGCIESPYTSGGGGGGGGGTISYLYLIDISITLNITYNIASTIGINNYYASVICLDGNYNLFSLYGKNASTIKGGSGGNAYTDILAKDNIILIPGINGFDGGLFKNNGDGYQGGLKGLDVGGGGGGGGPLGGFGGNGGTTSSSGSPGQRGGFGSGGGGGGGGGISGGSIGGTGGSPLITLEWLF